MIGKSSCHRHVDKSLLTNVIWLCLGVASIWLDLTGIRSSWFSVGDVTVSPVLFTQTMGTTNKVFFLLFTRFYFYVCCTGWLLSKKNKGSHKQFEAQSEFSRLQSVLFNAVRDLTLTRAHLNVFRVFESYTGGQDTACQIEIHKQETSAKPRLPKPLRHITKLTRPKARPNLFHSAASLSFLCLAPLRLSTAELLAVSNQCVHWSLLPPLLSSFFFPPLPFLRLSPLFSTRQVRY